MRSTSNDGENDVDQPLEELLPRATAQPGIGRWQVAEVSTDTAVLTEADSATIAPEVIASTRSKPTGRRFSDAQMLAVGLLVTSAVAISAYFLGVQRSSGDTALNAEVVTTSTTSAFLVSPDGSSDGASAQTVTVQVDENPVVEDEEEKPAPVNDSLGSLETQLETVDLTLVQFAPGTNQMTSGGQVALAELAAALKGYPSIPVSVAVWTFTEPDVGQNQGLSERQAEAVIEILIAKGVGPARLLPIGRGSALQQQQGDGTLAFDAEHPELAAKLARIGLATAALAADGTLTSEAKERLDQLAAAMAEYPEASVRLSGHAFADTAKVSHDLSHDVLDQATAYLTSLGVDPARLIVVGMGEEPIQSGPGTSVELVVGPPVAVQLAIGQIDTSRIGFESGTSQLTPESLDVLAEVALALAVGPTVQIEIAAYTYSEETSDRNYHLSHKQGEALRQALVQSGVVPDRLLVVGHGDPALFAEAGRDSYAAFRTVG